MSTGAHHHGTTQLHHGVAAQLAGNASSTASPQAVDQTDAAGIQLPEDTSFETKAQPSRLSAIIRVLLLQLQRNKKESLKKDALDGWVQTLDHAHDVIHYYAPKLTHGTTREFSLSAYGPNNTVERDPARARKLLTRLQETVEKVLRNLTGSSAFEWQFSQVSGDGYSEVSSVYLKVRVLERSLDLP